MRVEVFQFSIGTPIEKMKEELNTFIPYHKIIDIEVVIIGDKIVIFILYHD